MVGVSTPNIKELSVSAHTGKRAEGFTFYEIMFVVWAGHMGPSAFDSCPPQGCGSRLECTLRDLS